ncbi:hydrogenase [bacterium]|nr:hydrogenase [bacterium]
MIKPLLERLRQGRRTFPFPEADPELPERFRGLPSLDTARCGRDCGDACLKACPTGALSRTEKGVTLDLGCCLFCAECAAVCPNGAIRFTREYRLAASKRQDLLLKEDTLRLASALDRKALKLFGHSLKLRQVSAGGCNACESDVNVLNTLVFDLGRFGIQFVASPRHADGLLVTGPVTENMRLALEKTWAAVPAPKLVIAVGACAISGGPYRGRPETLDGVGPCLPVDLYVPGCPPHPWSILDGLLRLLDRLG